MIIFVPKKVNNKMPNYNIDTIVVNIPYNPLLIFSAILTPDLFRDDLFSVKIVRWDQIISKLERSLYNIWNTSSTSATLFPEKSFAPVSVFDLRTFPSA